MEAVEMTVYMVEPEMTGCWEQLGMMCWMAEVEIITLKAVMEMTRISYRETSVITQ